MKESLGQHIAMPPTQPVALSTHPPPPAPACKRQDPCHQQSRGVTHGLGGPIGTRLGVHASHGSCRDRRAGQGDENQDHRQGMGAIGLRGVEGKSLRREVLAVTGCGHGARPPARHPLFPHGEGRKLPVPGSLAGGGEQGAGLVGGPGGVWV